MRASPFAYLLIALLLFAPVDDVVVPTLVAPCESLPDNDDQYLGSEYCRHREARVVVREPLSTGLKAQAVHLVRGVFSGPDPAGFFDPPTLYVFMSLQC